MLNCPKKTQKTHIELGTQWNPLTGHLLYTVQQVLAPSCIFFKFRKTAVESDEPLFCGIEDIVVKNKATLKYEIFI